MSLERITRANPLGCGDSASFAEQIDSIERCAATLYMLADLFGGGATNQGYELLATPRTRHGVWIQLTAIAERLELLIEQGGIYIENASDSSEGG